MTDSIDELADLVDTLTEALEVAKKRLHAAKIAVAGVAVGDIVIGANGKRYRVCDVDPCWSKAWVKGNPQRADGKFGTAERNLFDRWTKELQEAVTWTHIMLDIETIGTRPGAVILSVALVRFTDEAQATLNLSIPDQEALGLVKDPATAAWWTGQEAQHPGAWAAATSNPVPLATALPYLASWFAWAEPDVWQRMIWCHGATFDAPLLGAVFEKAGLEPPWKFWNIQCTRTLYNLAGVDTKAYAVPPPHIALNDAVGQVRAANAALAVLATRRGIAPPAAPDPFAFAVATGTFCSMCQGPQYDTESGVTCANGHGGAEAAA